MVVKMRRWSATRKFQVAVKPMKLETLSVEEEYGGGGGGGGGGECEMMQKFVAIKIKWKGEPRKFFPLMVPFQRSRRQKKEFSSEKILKKGQQVVEWGEDKWFENTCHFSVVQNQEQKFGFWEIVFSILYGEKMDSKAKMAVIGTVSVNIAEIAWKMDNFLNEHKLPVSLKIDGVDKDAFLTVVFNLIEIRDQESVAIVGGDSKKCTEVNDPSHTFKCEYSVKGRRRALSEEEVSVDESTTFVAETNLFTKSRTSTISRIQLDPDKKEGWFSWKNRSFISFKRPRTKESTLDKITYENAIDADVQSTVSFSLDLAPNRVLQKDDPTQPSLESEHQYEESTTGAWEEKELSSRDGKTKLKASVFFASFDQRSNKAAGESACTALVAVISHWLHSNLDAMPNRLEFDNLIKQGSSEWRKLCENVSYVNDFPNKHFDLETVLRADIRPISISQERSFVGFFGAEQFESLKGAMSFDEIWNELSSNIVANDIAPSIFIVSWNDHFFVLKAEANAYYIIDTLGERLFEGCNQAYMLKFDDSTVIQIQADKEIHDQTKTEAEAEGSENTSNEEATEREKTICSGKECCREFIKRFLAAIPLKELEEEEKKEVVSYFSLHHRLQIEFNYSCCSPSHPSSTTSSLFSSPATSTFSHFPDEG